MFRPLASGNSNTQNLSQINDMTRSLNKEQQVKTFNGPGGFNAVTIGKVGENLYGLMINDGTDNRILIGQSPDGTYGLFVSKAGIDVLEELAS